jgi:hypothetical protein
MEQDPERLLGRRQGQFFRQAFKLVRGLFDSFTPTVIQMVINDDIRPRFSLNQRVDLGSENLLAGPALGGPQVGTLDTVIRIEKHEVGPGSRLHCALEPFGAGTGDLYPPVANDIRPVKPTGE